MKRKLFLILSLFLGLMAQAQNNISVASFRLLPNDMTANTQGTMRTDQNGHTAALIKVVTTQTGFTFDVGMMGIVDTKQEPGEIWVYVPFGVKHITIRHPQLGVLRDYYFPITIEEARTYEMVLASGTVSTIVESDVGGSYLMMTVEPKTAMVYIDEQLKAIENGEVMLLLPYGKHTYRVEAPSYMNEAGVVEIGKERVELNVKLSSAKATLTVNCPDAEADIYINEQKKGRGSWTGQIVDGMYVVEARKAGHRTEKQSLTLAKQEQKTVTLNAPQPIYGKLNLTSTPGNCDVYLDGKKIGKSPDVFANVLVGKHNVELRKEGYENATKQITITEGNVETVNVELKKHDDNALSQQVQQSNTPATKTSLLFTVKGVTFEMLPVEGGTFTMGAHKQGSRGDERPAHSVTLDDFYIGKTEVTQSLWQAVMENNPSYFIGSDLPVEQVSWNDCQEFIYKLNQLCASQLVGKQFQLPTEAEWEYAARGGRNSQGYMYSGSNNVSYAAWYSKNSNSKTHAVGAKQPNELGIYDMSGNVYEWCQDRKGKYTRQNQVNPTGPSSGARYVSRGGCWYRGEGCNTVTYRSSYPPNSTHSYLGFRIVLINIGEQENTKETAFETETSNNLTFVVNGVSFEMLSIDGGTFTMGATTGQGNDAESNEKPTHSVTLNSYYMGEYEVTQKLWCAVMGNNPSKFQGEDLPVEEVSWNDCQTFINKLNQLLAEQLGGKRFALPTEAQWEYAARGGKKSKDYKYSGSNTVGEVAWYDDNSGRTTHAVGTKTPNELGLYDMSGNVWEWCSDWYGSYGSRAQTNPTGSSSSSYRVCRGGSWRNVAWRCRVSRRDDINPDITDRDLGFRLVLCQ